MYSSSHDAWNSQEPAQQQQYHGSPVERGGQLWQRRTPHSDCQNDGDLGSYRVEYGILSDICDSPGSFEQRSYNTGSNHTNYLRQSNSGSSCIDPTLIQHSSQHQAYLTDQPPVAYPDPLTDTALSPALSPYQNGSFTQAAGYDTNQPNGYFDPNLNRQQYPVRQVQWQVASDHQNQEFYHSPDNSSSTHSLPPNQPVHDDKQDVVADNSNPGLHVCRRCKIGFKRQTDLERHWDTSKKHSPDPKGPSCPQSGCSYTARFTRPDNCKAHYKKLHGKSDEEADEFLQQWRDSDEGQYWMMKKRRGRGSVGR